MSVLEDSSVYSLLQPDPYSQDSPIAKSLTPGARASIGSALRTAIFAAPGLGAVADILFGNQSVGSALTYGAIASVVLVAFMPGDYLTNVATGDAALGFGVGYFGSASLGYGDTVPRATMYGIAASFLVAHGALKALGVANNRGNMGLRWGKGNAADYDDTTVSKSRRY